MNLSAMILNCLKLWMFLRAGSFDQSPNLNDVMCGWAESNITRQPLGSEEEDDKLRNSLAEAMVEASPMGDNGPTSTRLDGKYFAMVHAYWSSKTVS